jgi:hypothetical protein
MKTFSRFLSVLNIWNTIVIVPILILFIIGCTKEYHDKLPDHKSIDEVYSLIQESEVPLQREQVNKMLLSKMPSSPCKWDFNIDGKINSYDLQVVLAGYGTIYNVADINAFLAAYNEEYIVDVIILFQTHIQDVNCNLDWPNFPRYKCDGTLVALPISYIDSLNWIQNNEVISTDVTELDWKSYGYLNNPNCENSGYQPPCNGLQLVTQELYLNNHKYAREVLGFAGMNNSPVPMCPGNVSDEETLSYDPNSYAPLQFLVY